ncbi:hypothetical protein LXL04_037453 [Taraxacum kok-saghyz]
MSLNESKKGIAGRESNSTIGSFFGSSIFMFLSLLLILAIFQFPCRLSDFAASSNTIIKPPSLNSNRVYRSAVSHQQFCFRTFCRTSTLAHFISVLAHFISVSVPRLEGRRNLCYDWSLGNIYLPEPPPPPLPLSPAHPLHRFSIHIPHKSQLSLRLNKFGSFSPKSFSVSCVLAKPSTGQMELGKSAVVQDGLSVLQRPDSLGRLSVESRNHYGLEFVRPVHSGTATLKDATSEAIDGNWVTNVETTHYILGSVAGPHPYPMMVREFHAVIGKETRKQAMEKWGGGGGGSPMF